MAGYDANHLFDDRGKLRMELLSSDAQDVMWSIHRWLLSQDRRMFLPLDLLIILVEREHQELTASVASGTEGMVEDQSILPRLRALSKEIEEESSDHEPSFDRISFSRGFTRILAEAWEQAESRGRARPQIREGDLVRSMLWRAETVESASVRWAIRRLSEGGGDRLFDDKGLLREEVFQPSTWSMLQGAMSLAASQGTPFLGTPHLVAMLCTVPDSTLWRSARARGFEPSRLRDELLRLIGTRADKIPEFLLGRKTLTPRMVRMLSFSALQTNKAPIAEHHVVEGFLEDGGSSLELIQALGLESEIRNALGEPKVLAEVAPVEAAIRLGAHRRPSPTLDMLGRDLTTEALEGRLPDIVGRDKELQRVINVLLRKEQRNPLLTGEAGVGKTALAIALAQRIAYGRVHPRLQGHRVIEINGANLMSGTSYRGDLESRIKSLLEEASDEVILFIDEAHAVFAPRASSHAPAEIPNHFKSALASGQIAVVGATTEAEYRRWFEQDPALKRRFERIEVSEPSRPLVREILCSLLGELERDYEVEVDEDVVDFSIDLSVRYMPEQRLPDKAKKLLMDSCIARTSQLSQAARSRRGDSEAADEEAPEGDSLGSEVTREDVARQVYLKTGIPLDRLLAGEINWWVGIEDRLRQHVVGQDQAIHQVARALIQGRLRSADKPRPMSVLLFAGPPGVGKATLARGLAAEVFGDEAAMIRLEMTDYQEAHAISRLIGSPPGYVGYEDEDFFVTPLRRRPSSVILLEDFDRAHPRIQERLFRVIEEGEIADTRGYKADVRHAIVILTVKMDLPSASGAGRIGFAGAAAGAPVAAMGERALRDHLDRGFAQRLGEHVDAIVSFHGLRHGGADEPGVLADPSSATSTEATPAEALMLRHAQRFVQAMRDEYRVRVVLDDALYEILYERAASCDDARSVEALVEEMLYAPVTERLLEGITRRQLHLSWKDGRVAVHQGLPQDVSQELVEIPPPDAGELGDPDTSEVEDLERSEKLEPSPSRIPVPEKNPKKG